MIDGQRKQSLGKRLGVMLFDQRYRRVHYAVIALSLLVRLSMHYATYIPLFRGSLGGLPYFRLHILHEAEFLLIVAYASVVIGVRAGVVAIIITDVTSTSFILTPYIFDRDPRPNEIRDLVTQVAFTMLMGYLITLLYDRDKRSRVAENLRDTMAQMDQLRRAQLRGHSSTRAAHAHDDNHGVQ